MALLDRTARSAPAPSDEPDDLAEAERLPERILRLGAVTAVAGAVVQIASQLVNYFVFDLEVWNLDVDADNNAFAWASSVAQFAAAFCCLLLLVAGWWSSRRLLALVLILAFFSLDDIARFHENIGSAVREDVFGLETGFGRLIWPLIFFPLLAAAFILLWQFAERTRGMAGQYIRLGLVMLVLAVFAEAGSSAIHIGAEEAEGTLPDVLEVAVEESLELAAWVLIAAATAAILCRVLAERGRTSS